MSDSAPVEESDVEALPEPPHDLVLAGLVGHVNMEDPEDGLSITLFASGSIITGRLVSGRRFFDDLIQRNEGNAKDWWSMFFDRDRNLYASVEPEDQVAYAPVYAHVCNATVISGGRILQMSGWRGRLSCIDGWSFGEYTFGS